MPINLKPFGKIHKAFLYTDKVWVWRTSRVTKESGATEVLQPELWNRNNCVYKAQPCRLSFDYLDTTKDSNNQNIPIDYMPKLFILQTDLVVMAGDFFEVQKYDTGRTYRGTFGDIAERESHIEVYVRIDEHA